MTTNLHAPVIEDHRGRTMANFVTFCPFFSKLHQNVSKKDIPKFSKIRILLIHYSELALFNLHNIC